jgi:hypothetical protein
MPNPSIYQEPVFIDTPSQSLSITAQPNFSGSHAGGDLFLYSGYGQGTGNINIVSDSGLGQNNDGNINLFSGSGNINLSSTTNFGLFGNINLFTGSGKVVVDSIFVEFSEDVINPIIYQADISGVANDLTIQSQNNLSGIAGNLFLVSGISHNFAGDGDIILNSNTGNVNVKGNSIIMHNPVSFIGQVSGNSYQLAYTSPVGGVVSNSQFISYNTVTGTTDLLDTSNNIVKQTIFLLPGDILISRAYFRALLSSGSQLFLTCVIYENGNVKKTYDQGLNGLLLSGGITGNIANELVFPMYYVVSNDFPAGCTVEIHMYVGIIGGVTVSNLYISNSDWLDLQVWRPIR